MNGHHLEQSITEERSIGSNFTSGETRSVQAVPVTIVIPTYNSVGLLRGCLDSLRDLDYPKEHTQVIVVDNASTDGTAEILRLRYPHVRVSAEEANTGFARACNRGAALADTEYIAFLNDDALAERGWLRGLFAGLAAGGEGAICAASQIRSRDGKSIEYDGASSNLYGAGRPMSVWGWPDMPDAPGEGSPLLFASGGAMLIHRATFLEIGGFDPEYFAYFEDVDLGWRLWTLGYKVVYAPHAVVRHTGGATGSRSPIYRRYTLWECNSLATIIKNYETGNMERILSAALLLQYRRALLSTGDAIDKASYNLTSSLDTSTTNVERIPRVSVAHLAAIDRLNSMLPHLMSERKRIQASRVRSDAEILPLLGHAWQPQFAGTEYAESARKLASDFGLYEITARNAPNRVLIAADAGETHEAETLASKLASEGGLFVALAELTPDTSADSNGQSQARNGFTLHRVSTGDKILRHLAANSDAILLYSSANGALSAEASTAPRMAVAGAEFSDLLSFCLDPSTRS